MDFISVFASSVISPVCVTSFAVSIKSCQITTGIKKYESFSKNKKKKRDKKMLLATSSLHSIKVLFSQALIDWYINRDKFVSISNVLGEYYEIKIPETSVKYTI